MHDLSSLSEQELVCGLKHLVRQEGDTTLSVIEHLAEFDRRKTYLGLGYQSLFSYCTSALRYSEPAANRRIKAARCMRDFPEVYELLKNSQVNLSTICIFAPILTAENKTEVLAKVSNQSKDKVEQVVAAYKEPRAKDVRDSITPIVVKAPVVPETKHETVLPSIAPTPTTGSGQESGYRLRDGGNHSSFSGSPTPQPAAIAEERIKFTFSGSKDFAAMVEKIRVLLSSKNPSGAGLEEIFQEAMQCFIDKHDPEQKAKRTLARKEKQDNKVLVEDGAEKQAPSRYIPAAVRAEVMLRDGGRCTYVAEDGHRCGSKWDLELDHIVPYAKGGENTAANLTSHCRVHNLHKARADFSSNVIDSYCKAKSQKAVNAG